MSTLDLIKADRMTAMREGDTRTKEILTVLLGDLESDSKRGIVIDDAYIVKTIKKAVQNATDNYNRTGDDKFFREGQLLEGYLPKQMSEDKLRSEIANIIETQGHNDTPTNIGTVMAALKAEHDGSFDGGLAAKIVKEMV